MNSGRGELHRGGRGPFGAGNVKQDALEAEKNPALAEPEIEPVDEPAPVADEEVADAAEEEEVGDIESRLMGLPGSLQLDNKKSNKYFGVKAREEVVVQTLQLITNF